MLGMGIVQKHLRDNLLHGLQKQQRDSIQYLCDDPRDMYPQFMTAAHKAEYEYEDRPGERAQVR